VFLGQFIETDLVFFFTKEVVIVEEVHAFLGCILKFGDFRFNITALYGSFTFVSESNIFKKTFEFNAYSVKINVI